MTLDNKHSFHLSGEDKYTKSTLSSSQASDGYSMRVDSKLVSVQVVVVLVLALSVINILISGINTTGAGAGAGAAIHSNEPAITTFSSISPGAGPTTTDKKKTDDARGSGGHRYTTTTNSGKKKNATTTTTTTTTSTALVQNELTFLHVPTTGSSSVKMITFDASGAETFNNSSIVQEDITIDQQLQTENEVSPPPTSMCFVTCNYAKSIEKADRTPDAVLAEQPGVYHFLFTNLETLPVPKGWIAIVNPEEKKKMNKTDTKPTYHRYKSSVTQSRYGKFLAWQVPEIQRYCRAVFYMDATYQTVASVEVYQALADRLHDNNTSSDWMQYRHPERTQGGPLEELKAIRKFKKDTPEHIQATITWLEQQAPAGGKVENVTKWLSEMPVYLNTLIAYDPTNIKFQKLTLDFWSEYSQERTSWRDQPLWAYFVWKHGNPPQSFPTAKRHLFLNNGGKGFGGHRYTTTT